MYAAPLQITATGLLISGPGSLTCVTARATTAGTLDFYDGPANNANLIATMYCPINANTPPFTAPKHACRFVAGLYVVVTTWVGLAAALVDCELSGAEMGYLEAELEQQS